MTADGRRGLAIIGGGKIGEALLSGLVRRGGPDGARRLRAQPGAGRGARRALRRPRARPRRRRRAGPGAAAGGQAAGHRHAARPARRASSTTGTWSSRSPRACPTARIEAALPAGVPVVRVMPNTPALVDEGMSVLSAGRARRRGAPGRGRGAAGGRGPGAPGAGEPAGRRHGAVGQRAGVLLLPGRGDGRRRHPARACRARWPPTWSCRRRWARR